MQAKTGKKVSVFGSGNWGTALAHLMASNGHSVYQWVREKEVYEGINSNHKNPLFLKDIDLPKNIIATMNAEEASKESSIIILVVPSQFIRSFIIEARDILPVGVPIVICSKGIELGTLQTMHEVLIEELPGKYHNQIAILSGPSFALEVGNKYPTNVTVASYNPDTAKQVQKMVSALYFRAYTSSDVIGVEFGGATKNVIAIAAGGSDGIGYGHNSRAGLITRGLAEITRLAKRKGANPETLAGLSGMGDLVLTCTGELSRNRTVGFNLAQGKTIKQILDEMNQVAEGVHSSKSIYLLSKKLEVEMPITEQVYQVVHEDKLVKDAVKDLLTRSLKDEIVE